MPELLDRPSHLSGSWRLWPCWPSRRWSEPPRHQYPAAATPTAEMRINNATVRPAIATWQLGAP
eukprot:10063785-Lingulodinium_polyedra.AAC.1